MRGKEHLQFLTCVCKSGSLPNMSQSWLSSARWSPFAKSGTVSAQYLRRVGKHDGPTFQRLWTKVRVIWRQRKGRFAVPCCLWRVSLLQRYLSLSLESSKKNEKCVKIFGLNFSSGVMTPKYLLRIVSAVYFLPFGKVSLSSVCWRPCMKPGNEMECKINGGLVKTPVQFKTFVDQSSWSFETM